MSETVPITPIPPVFELDYDRRVAALEAAKKCLENNGGHAPNLLAMDAVIHAFVTAYNGRGSDDA